MHTNLLYRSLVAPRVLGFLLAVLALLTSLSAHAQGGYVRGTVVDALTGDGVHAASVELLRPDSSAVDRTEATSRGSVLTYQDHQPASFELSVPQPGMYLLRVSMTGYMTLWKRIEVSFRGRNRYFEAGELALKRLARRLGEATVKATRIKMVYRGDTLVYNADAFDLPDGSMLDDLIERLPGARLENGRIYVNGRYVENILLEGKDFFNGNAELALQNLPAYVVGKVKVYEKEGERSKTMGRDMGDRSYVMDVQLKPDYQGSWTGNADLAYGTEKRYSAPLFGMYMDRRQGILLSTDVNNLNTVREQGGNYSGSAVYRNGRVASKQAVLNYHYEPDERLDFSTGFKYRHTSTDAAHRTHTETYLTGGNAYGRSSRFRRGSDDEASGNIGFGLRPRKGRFLNVRYQAEYKRCRESSVSALANFNTAPDALGPGALDSALVRPLSERFRRTVTSRTEQVARFSGYDARQQVTATAHFAFAPDLLEVNAGFDQRHRHDEQFDHYRLDYPAGDDPVVDFRNRYYDKPADNRKGYAEARYFFRYVENDTVLGHVQPFYRFDYAYSSEQNPLYRLDALPGWGAEADRPLGLLPSTRDSVQRCIDAQNSWFSTLRTLTHRGGFKFLHKQPLRRRGWLTLSASLPLRHQRLRMDYERGGTPRHVDRGDFFVEPQAGLQWYPLHGDPYGALMKLSLNYALSGEQPSALYLVDVRDDSDPLHVSLGNAGLANAYTHQVSAQFARTWPKRSVSFDTQLSYGRVKNAVAMKQVYDRATGVSTVQPVNVDGNYNLSSTTNINIPFDREQKFILFLYNYLRYAHSRDLTFASGAEASALNVVYTVRTEQQAALTWMPSERVYLRGQVGVSRTRATGDREDFAAVRVLDLECKLEGKFKLPADFSLNAEGGFLRRYGYGDTDAGNRLWTLNARLDKSLLKNKLALAVEGVNLLAKKNFAEREINAQGRTETFYDVLPRYVLFHVIYKFNLAPKKRTN